jgi:hypothetical protein
MVGARGHLYRNSGKWATLFTRLIISNVLGSLIRLVSFVREWKLQRLPCYYINFSAQLAPSRSGNS